MAKAKFMVFSGFLGAGKTTSMIAITREIDKKYGKGAIIANDLGARNLVDAEYTATTDLSITEIAGDCICYQTENLVDKLNRLVDAGADVIMSDIPGCGIGALDHVYLALDEQYPSQFEMLPLVCIVDPVRLSMVLPEGDDINLPEEMRFLLGAQMAEADLIVLNKVDVASDEERARDISFIEKAYPHIPVMAMSARTGEGVSEITEYIMTHKANMQHREIGYGSKELDAAEELMSWYNRRMFFKTRDGSSVDFNAFIDDFIEEIRTGLIDAKRNVPHLKIFSAVDADEFYKASLIGIDYDIEHESTFTQAYPDMPVVVNARAICESETMAEIVDDATDFVKEKYGLKCHVFFTECFGMMDEGRKGGRASR